MKVLADMTAEELRDECEKWRSFVAMSSGMALALAMSGRDHPRFDEILMTIVNGAHELFHPKVPT